ncbi:MAG: 4-hydroxy-3-methylbut-2-enyl diphosphate reductase [Clostridiales bacterium]|nr:4-hydroxy-3-methylbut-2-enyl diphosphate reductase [Clostridiales bacterium]
MMEITVAKHSGFCMGVTRAVEVALSAEGDRIYVLGELIHNPATLAMLEKRGIKKVDSIDEIEGGTVIIRSHGIGEADYLKLMEKSVKIVDATCVFVKNIQKKAKEFYEKGYQILIIGDRYHPEVKGINGWCGGTAIICDDEGSVPDLSPYDKVCVLCQTTFSKEKYDKILKNIVKDGGKKVEVFNTICYTTIERQKEAQELSRTNDCVIVIGGKVSSNTQKLKAICEEECSSVFSIETPAELDLEKIRQFKKVAIVAGASTPRELIKEVYSRMEQMINAGTPDEQEEVKVQEMTGQKEVEDIKAKEGATEEVKEQQAQPQQEQAQGEEKADKGPIMVQEMTGQKEAEDIKAKEGAAEEVKEQQAQPQQEQAQGEEKADKGSIKVQEMTGQKEVEDIKAKEGATEEVKEQQAQPQQEQAQGEEKADKDPVKGAVETPAGSSVMDQALKQVARGNRFRRGQVTKATIALVGDEGLSLAIGSMKKEILLDKDNIEIDGAYDKSKYAVGDIIEVVVIKPSPLEVSRKQYFLNKRDEAFIEELKQTKDFKVKIAGTNSGGLVGEYGSFSVFIPASHIKLAYVKSDDFGRYLNKELKVRLLEVKGRTLIASAKEIILEDKKKREEARAAAVKAFFDSIEVGQIVEGKVVRFTNFGAFVNVNGFDCLAHISDLSWVNVKKPEDVLEKNKVYEFVILNIDKGKEHVSLGYKQLQPKPWDLAAEKYPAGSVIKGKVVRIAPFGAFVEVEPGVDGLVHVSQITHEWIENPASALKVGDEVEAKVLDVNPEAQKLTLSIKALLPEPEAESKSKKKEDKKPKAEKKAKQSKAEEMREWNEETAAVSIGDLIKDLNINL